jgi:hypothetical protein
LLPAPKSRLFESLAAGDAAAVKPRDVLGDEITDD